MAESGTRTTSPGVREFYKKLPSKYKKGVETGTKTISPAVKEFHKTLPTRYGGRGGGSSRGGGVPTETGTPTISPEVKKFQEQLTRAGLIEQSSQRGTREQTSQEKLRTNTRIEEANKNRYEQFGTAQYKPNILKLPTPSNDVTIEKRVIDYVTDKNTMQKIPITEILIVDKSGIGKQKERVVTAKEREFFESQTSNLVIIPKKKGVGAVVQKVTRAAEPSILFGEKLDFALQTSITKPISASAGALAGAVGFGGTFEEVKEDIKGTTTFLESKGVPKPITQTGEFIAGMGIGAVEDLRDKPLKNLALLGGGYTLGASVEAGGLIASKVGVSATTKLASGTGGFFAKGLSYTPVVYSSGVNVLGLGVGGIYVAEVGKKISESETPLEAGSIFGSSLKDVGLLGAGSVAGTKTTQKVFDIFRTKGRAELPVEDVGLKSVPEVISGKDRFVESKHFGGTNKAGAGKQKFDLSVFERAGRSYHATGEKFWDKGFVTTKGSSEVEGLYVAPSPSYYFLKSGETPVSLFSLYKGGKSPSVARIYGKGFSTKQTGASGVGYVTGKKPEIEAVFPAESGFIKTGSETFVKVGGRKIPIDTFSSDITNVGGKIIKGEVISGSYSSSLGSNSLISPVSLFGLSSSMDISSSPVIKSSLSYPSSSSSSGSDSSVSSSSSGGSSSPSISISKPFSISKSSSSSSSSSSFLGSGSSGSSSISTSPPLLTTRPGGGDTSSLKKIKALVQEQGYLSQIKEKGKWKNIDSKARNRENALKISRFVVDNVTSQAGRIIPSSKSPAKDTLKNLRVNSQKFREYRISKGKKIPLKNSGFIEKRKYAIEKNESRDLLAFKRSSQYKSKFKGGSKAGKRTPTRRKTNWLSF